MSTQSAFFHALLRPSILQILRATGYHSARPSVIDSLTDIAARYLTALCLSTASHAVHNHGDAGDYNLVDVLMALQDVGAVQPAKKRAMGLTWQDSENEGQNEEEDEENDDDCAEGWVVDEFVEWFAGQRMRELMLIGRGDGEIEATDYLSGVYYLFSRASFLGSSVSFFAVPFFFPSPCYFSSSVSYSVYRTLVFLFDAPSTPPSGKKNFKKKKKE